MEDQILAAASPKVGIWGIELLDVKIKGLNYKQGVIEKIYDRMKFQDFRLPSGSVLRGLVAAKISGKKERSFPD